MAGEAPTRAGGVQSVERVFKLLETITDAGGEATLSELSSSTALPVPTIHRLLRTLISLGYARQLPNRRYALGPRLMRLGEGAARQFGALARPALTRLVETLGESANMAVLDADRVVYVAQVPSLHSVRMFTEVGRRVDLHDSGVGKAILAQLSDDAVVSIVRRTGMPTPTPNSIGTVDTLLSELALIRSRGYAVDDEEQEVGVRCFAMAIPDAPTPSAVSVSGPVTRINVDFDARAVPLLREAVSEIANRALSD